MKKALLALALATALAGKALGAPPTDEKLAAGPTMGELVEYALAKNPLLLSAREEWRGQVENIRVMDSWEDPEVMIEQMGFTDPTWTARVTVMAPYPGKIAAASEAAASMATASRFEAERTARDVAISVRETGAEVAYLQAARKIAQKSRELLSRLDNLANANYAGGRGELIDLARARGQVEKVGFDAVLTEELLASEKARLNLLLARPEDAPLGELTLPAPATLVYSSDEIAKLTLERPEELKIAGALIEKAKSEVRSAKLASYPDFTLGAFKNPLESGGEMTYGVAVSFTVPLWQAKNNGRVAAAEAMQRKEEAMLNARKLELRAEARDLYFRVRNAERLHNLYRETLLPQAARSLQVAETWLKGEQADLSDYIEVATTLYGFELALARSSADHARYLARLEKLAGQQLTVRPTSAGEVAK